MAATTGTLLTAITTTATAEIVPLTTQAKTIHAEWLAYAPPPTTKKAVCLIDTGVTLNPDTDAVTLRESLDGGDPNDAGPPGQMHGTDMAMTMIAPKNDWGSVGIAPQSINVLSIRANIPGKLEFFRNGYENGLTRCQDLNNSAGSIAAIEMAIIGKETDPAYIQLINATVERLKGFYGVSVVAAGGNSPGPLQFPAAVDPVLSVGAYDPVTGGLCDFSASGADILAPGCSVDSASPLTGEPTVMWGTSSASAIVSAVLTAFRSYRPDLSRQQAEDLLFATAKETSAGKLVDVEALFRAAGLDAVVDGGKAAMPPPSPGGGGQPPVTNNTPVRETVLPVPKIKRVRRKNDWISVQTQQIEDDVTLVVQAVRGRKTKTVRSDTFATKVKLRGATKIVCWYTFPGVKSSKKLTITLKKRSRR